MAGGISLDLTVSLGTMIEVGTIIAGGATALAIMRTTIGYVKQELLETKRDTKDQFEGIQSEIKKIGEVLIVQADMNRRVLHLEEDIREMKHGHGFVKGVTGIDREFP